MVKKGFSLVEALVVMTILAVFFAFGARVITQKPKLKKQNNEHGYYECYYRSGGLYENYVVAGAVPVDKPVSKCVFDMRTKAAFYNVHVVLSSYKTKSGGYQVSLYSAYRIKAKAAADEAFRNGICAKYNNKNSCTMEELNIPDVTYVRETTENDKTVYFMFKPEEVSVSNQSHHSSFEPNINDVLTFDIPDSMQVHGQKSSFALVPNDSVPQFKTYLKSTYPSAGIYDSFKDEVLPGVMLIW